MEDTQKLQVEVIQLKARLLDAKDSLDGVNAAISRIAQAVGYQDNNIEGLIQAITALQTEEKEDE